MQDQVYNGENDTQNLSNGQINSQRLPAGRNSSQSHSNTGTNVSNFLNGENEVQNTSLRDGHSRVVTVAEFARHVFGGNLLFFLTIAQL